MNNFPLMSTCVLVAVVMMTCRAGPVSPLFADEKAEKDSLDVNEVGPEEDWNLLNRLTKTKAYDNSDYEKTKELIKEIKEFSRLVTTVNPTEDPDNTTDQSDGMTETNFAPSSDSVQNDDGNASNLRPQFERQDDGGNVEDIIKKLSTDLKKLYTKIKQVLIVVKNWVDKTRGSGQMSEYDGQFPMTASASESDGVFVIADHLIGDVDKSNKYTVPIIAD